MRVTIVQPAIPTYRRPLFERLATHFGSSFSVYASPKDDLGVLDGIEEEASWQNTLGAMRMVFPGAEWQVGALSVPASKGDMLIVCGAPRTISTLALLLKGKWVGARTVWWGHYWSATSKSWRAAIRFLIMRLPDAMLFYTDLEAQDYLSSTGRPKPVFALNNGLDTGLIKQFREPYEAQKRSRDLVFMGRVTAKGELDLLLDALASPLSGSATLDIIGDGPSLPALKQYSESLGLAERVAWHGAIVEEKAIARICNQCKVFVYPGSVGLSLIHAFAYGLPALVHGDRWRHMPEIAAFRDTCNGISFRRGDGQSLALSVARMFSGSCNRMSAEAVETVERSFNIEDMCVRFIEAVDVMSGRRTND